MILNTLAQLLKSNVDHIIVVTGHQSTLINEMLIDLDIHIVHNPNYQDGMVTSIQAGLKHKDLSSPFMITHADLPWIKTADYNWLIDHYLQFRDERPSMILQPVNNQTTGHPVIFDAQYTQKILALSGKKNLKSFVQQFQSSIYRVKTHKKCFFADIDTLEDYNKSRS